MTEVVNTGRDTGCGCEHARANLEELIRGELAEGDCASIRQHLESCSECRDEQHVFEKLTVAVRRACEGPAPDTLRNTIMMSLRSLHVDGGAISDSDR